VRALLDVNVLIALLDEQHEMHTLATHWFNSNVDFGWATCPITENGCLRIMSQNSYPNPLSISQIAHRLCEAVESARHHFWPDDVSLLTAKRILWQHIIGPKQVTDIYLLSLAIKHRGMFVTFDNRINPSVVAGANRHLHVA